MAWTLYKEIRYATDGIPGENLTDFPKRFAIVGDSDIAAELTSGGGVKVTNADGTVDLPIEILSAGTNLASGDVEFWTKLTLLTAANVGDVMCRLYYSSGESTTQDPSAVWSNNYAMVLHLEQDPSGSAPQMYDSVSETNVGTSAGSMTSGDLVAGQVGKGLDFDGNNDYLALPTPSVFHPITVEAIVNASTLTRSHVVWSQGENTNSWTGQYISVGSDGSVVAVSPVSNDFSAIASSPTSAVSAGQFYHLAGVWGSTSDRKVFVNGSLEGSNTTSANPTPIQVQYVGRTFSTADPFGSALLGIVDELRISSVARSEDWLSYSYIDDFDNADTFTLGDEKGATGEVSLPILAYHYQHHLGSMA